MKLPLFILMCHINPKNLWFCPVSWYYLINENLFVFQTYLSYHMNVFLLKILCISMNCSLRDISIQHHMIIHPSFCSKEILVCSWMQYHFWAIFSERDIWYKTFKDDTEFVMIMPIKYYMTVCRNYLSKCSFISRATVN